MFINHTLIFTREKRAKKSGQTVIIVHGIAEHSGRYEEMMSYFETQDISTFAFDLRGHGQSAGKRGKLSNFKLILEDINGLVTHVKKTYPEDQVFLLGHSLGGLITHMYAVTYQDVCRCDYFWCTNTFFKKCITFKDIRFKIAFLVCCKNKFCG